MQWIGSAVSYQIAFASFSASLTLGLLWSAPKQPGVGSRSVPFDDPKADLGGDLSRAGTSLPAMMFSRESTYTKEAKMDQSKPREIAKNAAEQASQTANDAVQRVGEQVQPALDRGKAAVHDLANQASEAGRQVADRAGEFIEGVTPRARQVASNLYDQGSRSGEYVRQYAAEQPVTALLFAGLIGFTLGYLVRGR
jgi:ElaB/YqjD/DUF883 family membrane-anchored ribosome-binding protein